MPNGMRSQEETDALRAAGAAFINAGTPQKPLPGFDLHVDGASGNPDLEREVLKVLDVAFSLWKMRQLKYGTSNIATTGELGCVVRASDKVARLRNALIAKKGMDVADESVVDSWLDLMNYAMMGYMCHRRMWPGAE